MLEVDRVEDAESIQVLAPRRPSPSQVENPPWRGEGRVRVEALAFYDPLRQQRQRRLRLRIRQSQNRGGGTYQNLRSRQVRGFRREVSIPDRTFRGSEIFPRHLQRVHCGHKRIFLERTQPTAQRGHPIDRRTNDALC